MIPKEVIEIITTVGLVEAIGREVELKKNGSEYKGFSPFKNEKSPSFTVNEAKGIWKCFATGKGGKTAVDFYLELENDRGRDWQWIDAVRHVAGLMNIPIDSSVPSITPKPTIDKRPSRVEEKAGTKLFKFKDFTKQELGILGPRVSESLCLKYGLKSVEMVSHVKENEVVEITSNETYPIFAFDFGEWQKIYQPRGEKAFRFSYAGIKPARFIFGWDYLKKSFNQRKADYDAMSQQISELEDRNQLTSHLKLVDPQVDAVYIMSGGSDALNMASMNDRFVIWFNSETEVLEYEEYRSLKAWAKEIYYVADLDATGVRQAVKVGLTFMDIKIIWLPDWLKNVTHNGKPCKDFKDYVVKSYNNTQPVKFENTLSKLIETSVAFQFWSETYQDKKVRYNLSATKLYNFLKHLGFGRFENPNLKEGYLFVRIEGSIVRILEPFHIANFIHHFLEERRMPVDLRDAVYNTPLLSEKSLANLQKVDVDFTVANRDFQLFFFRNQVWKITAAGIEEYKPGEIPNFIWEDKVIDFTPRKTTEPFTIGRDESKNFDIQINQHNNSFLNYLINTSRVHWRKDLEDSFAGKPEADMLKYAEEHKFDIAGPNLSEEEIYEQKLHLINKIYSIGYLLHQFKNESKAWCIFAMDNKISEEGESHGGTGKSICYSYKDSILKRRVVIKGRDPKITDNQFIYSAVTEDTDFILIDDAHRRLDFEFFFSEITGSLIVNPKNNKSFEIPFARAPKFVITSNFTPMNIAASTARRLLYTVFSDYYHPNKDGAYKQERQVSDDFDGRNLFKDFTAQEWNDYYNFCAYAVKFFLSHPFKIDPPMNNVTKRNLITEMTSNFKDWADVFFYKMEVPLGALPHVPEQLKYQNQYFSKEEAFESLKSSGKMFTNWTSQKFKRALQAYCQYNNWIFNPAEMGTKDGRILKKFRGETQEVIFIKTTEDTLEEAHAGDMAAMQAAAEDNQPDPGLFDVTFETPKDF